MQGVRKKQIIMEDTGYNSVPTEIIFHISNFLGEKDVISCSSVCFL